MPPKGQSKKAKQNPPKKAPVPGPAPAGKAEAPTPSNHIHTDSDLPLPIPPPQLPRGALIEATLPTIAIQSPSNASNALSPQAGGHYKPPKESQQAAQWGNEQGSLHHPISVLSVFVSSELLLFASLDVTLRLYYTVLFISHVTSRVTRNGSRWSMGR